MTFSSTLRPRSASRRITKGAKTGTAKVLSAWEAAGVRGVKRKDQEAVQRSTDKHRKRGQSEHLQLIRAYNEVHEELRPKLIPVQVYIDNKMAQLEDGEIQPDKMSHVIAKVEEKEDNYDGAYIQYGAIKVTTDNKVANVALPRNTEELRYRTKLMATTWDIVRLQLPMHPAIQD